MHREHCASVFAPQVYVFLYILSAAEIHHRPQCRSLLCYSVLGESEHFLRIIVRRSVISALLRRSVISALSLRRSCIVGVFLCQLACECSLIKRASTFGQRLAACISACRFRLFSLRGGLHFAPPSVFFRFALCVVVFRSRLFNVFSCQDVPHS